MRVVVIAFLLVAVSSVASRFGDYPDLSHAENLQIVHPKIYESVRKRRSVHTNCHLTRTKVVKLGDWFVELDPGYNSFVAPDLKAEWFNADEFRSLKALVECRYYGGAVRGLDGSSRAAVTLCGSDVTAFVDFGDSAYFVEPLNDTGGAHVLYHSKGSLLRRKRSGYQDYFLTDVHPSKQWMFNLTGDTIDIGEEDDEIHQKEDTGSNKKSREDVVTRNDSSREDNNTRNEVQDWHREVIMREDEGGYFLDSAWTANAIKSRKASNNHLPTRWLEIAVAVDHTLVSFHGKDKVEKYVLSLMNIVSAIYRDPSLKANLKLVVTRLLLYDHKKHGTIRPGHAKRSLENVNNWNKRLYASLKPDEPKHDLAIWLTRSDIGGPSGYAPVAGVCDPKRSCALNRDEGLTSAFIIAHETAHVLGLTHDGDHKNDNDCEEEALEGSIMAPMVSATFNKFLWSECSRKEFWDNADKWFCLLNPPAGSGIIPLNATLDTSFSMDEQCRMEFGDGYSMCRTFEIIEPCSHLWCGHRNSPTVCKTKKGPPLEGTECGFGKWCVNGYCEEVSKRADRIPVVLNPQDGGWGDWRPWGPCSRTCGIGVRFRSRRCNNPEPSYGGKYCEGESEEWRICHLDRCPEPFIDIRALQCKQLPKIFNLEATNDVWLPYESDEESKKCKFICVNSEKKELYVTDENLLDGTPCSYEDADSICVQGKCEIIGCDGNRKSKLRRDKCGICGGNNTHCSDMNISKTRKLKREASRVSVLPRMAREIKVEVNVTVYHSDNPVVALVLKNRRKKRYTVTIPNTIVHSKILEGAKFSYRKFNNQHSMWSKGPLHAEMVILIVVPGKELKSGINITYHTEYTIHKDFIVPSKRFKWIMGGWGPCTASCGGGTRRETTACWDDLNKKLVKRTYCSLIQKPKLKSEKCNTFGCNFQWISGEWEPCTTSCGMRGAQSREIYCVPSSVLNTILFKNNGTVSNLWIHMVDPNKCSGNKPTTMKTCNKAACPSYWNFGDWSQCSASCGSGTQTRSFFCPQPNDEEFFSCGDPPPSQRRVCSANHTRRSNHSCREKKLRRCTDDQSQYCSIPLLRKYCRLNGFKRMCCKSCRSYNADDM